MAASEPVSIGKQYTKINYYEEKILKPCMQNVLICIEYSYSLTHWVVRLTHNNGLINYTNITVNKLVYTLLWGQLQSMQTIVHTSFIALYSNILHTNYIRVSLRHFV